MKHFEKWYKLLWILAVLFVIIGTIDPLEGSVLIAAGSILLAVLASARADRHKLNFQLSAMLIVVGVAGMFWLSSLGGIGGGSQTSMWWGITILPYPLGWLLLISTLIYRFVSRKRSKQEVL